MATIRTRSVTAVPLTANQYDENIKLYTNAQAGNYPVVAADNRSTIEYTGAGGHTVTMPDVVTMKASGSQTGDFETTIKNGGAGTLTVAFFAGDTVDGVDADITLASNESITLKAGTSIDWIVTEKYLVVDSAVKTFLTTPTSANLRAAVTGDTGTGNLVFATSPALTTPSLGVATATSINGATITSGTLNGSVTGTNTGDQTSIVGITGTMAQFDTAVSDGNVVYQSQALGTPASGTLTNCTDTLRQGTVQPSTSGTTIDFLAIPAGVKRISVNFYNVSLDGTDDYKLQIGDAGGIETTTYESSSSRLSDATAVATVASTTCFIIFGGGAGQTLSGTVILSLVDAASFTWVASGSLQRTGSSNVIVAGHKALSATLDRIRIRSNVSDNFDSGSINIQWEL